MISINPSKIIGNQIYKIVWRVVKERKKTDSAASLSGFCRDAGISKQQLIQYKHGAKPGNDGIVKIATGLRKWGVEVEIII